jgi:hypothetical protein
MGGLHASVICQRPSAALLEKARFDLKLRPVTDADLVHK